MTREDFLKGIDDWSNHRTFLWQALEATKGTKLPVIELGCGEGSTPFLIEYCDDEDRWLLSYDNNYEWARKYMAHHVVDWKALVIPSKRCSVVLIDHAPGEDRRDAIMRFLPVTDIIVIHDSEPVGHNASDYRVRELFSNFKYVKDLEAPSPKAWSTVLSNTINVTNFDIDYPSNETTPTEIH